MSADKEVQHLELGSPPLTSSHGWKGHCPIQSFNMWMTYCTLKRFVGACHVAAWQLEVDAFRPWCKQKPEKKRRVTRVGQVTVVCCGTAEFDDFFGLPCHVEKLIWFDNTKYIVWPARFFCWWKFTATLLSRPWSLPTKVIAGMWRDVWLVPWSMWQQWDLGCQELERKRRRRCWKLKRPPVYQTDCSQQAVKKYTEAWVVWQFFTYFTDQSMESFFCFLCLAYWYLKTHFWTPQTWMTRNS